jgi:hypothetical protein
MRFGLTKQQIIHILKVAGWVSASTVIGLLISIITEQPDVFGVITPIVNLVLVTLQQMLKKPEEA